MHLAPLEWNHRAPLQSLLEATQAFSADEVEVALELFDSRFEGPAFALSPDYEFIGAFAEDDRLIGYACFGPTPSTDGTWDLYWLAVHPDAQGRGAGRGLMQWVESELESRDARLLVVETSSRTEYAHTREFYARGGYVEAARVCDFYAPADDRIIYTTRLTARERGAATR